MKPFVQAAAEADILHEIERYTVLGRPDVALRFQTAVLQAFDRIAAMPLAGAPKAFQNPKLAGLRTWPVKGFDEFRIFYLVDHQELTIVRVLHGKRDVVRILDESD